MIKLEKQETIDQKFKRDCKLINLQKEYPGFDYTTHWAISSYLSEDEIIQKYPEIVKQFTPFIFITAKQFKAFKKFESNNRKFSKRYIESTDGYGYEEGLAEIHHKELTINPFDDDWFFEKQNLQSAIKNLNAKQQERIVKYFFYGLTLEEISKQENVSFPAVRQGLCRALEQIKKQLL